MPLPLKGSPPGSSPASEYLLTVGIPEGTLTDLPATFFPTVRRLVLAYGSDREVKVNKGSIVVDRQSVVVFGLVGFIWLGGLWAPSHEDRYLGFIRPKQQSEWRVYWILIFIFVFSL